MLSPLLLNNIQLPPVLPRPGLHSSVQFSYVQDGTHFLRNAHMGSTMSFIRFQKYRLWNVSNVCPERAAKATEEATTTKISNNLHVVFCPNK